MSIDGLLPFSAREDGYFDVAVAGAYRTTTLRPAGGDAAFVSDTTVAGTGATRQSNWPTGTRSAYASGYVECEQAASGNAPLLVFFNATANITVRQTSAGVLQLVLGASTTNGATVNVATDGSAYHRLELLVVVNAGVVTLSWWWDGAAQTGASVSQLDADLTGMRVGNSSTTVTGKWAFTDWVYGFTAADAPVGEYRCNGYAATADGAHNATSGAFKDDTGATVSNSTTTVNAHVSEPPTNLATWVAQTAVAAGAYVEVAVADTTQAVPPALVSVKCTFAGAAAGTFLSEVRASDGFAESGDVAPVGTAPGNVPAKSGTTQRYGWSFRKTSPNGSAWTVALFDALRIRFGYSGDVVPNPRLMGVHVGAAVPAGAAPPPPPSGVEAVPLGAQVI